MAPSTTVFIIFIIYCLSFAEAEAFVLVDFTQCEAAVNTVLLQRPDYQLPTRREWKPYE
jgi:hypothetical protein